MHRATRRLLLILITVIAYLPMTAVYAAPNVVMTEQVQSATEMNMNDCHQQQSQQKCGHCSEQHSCNSAYGSCSTSFAIPAHFCELMLHQNPSSWYVVFDADTSLKHTTTLLRPPILL